MNHGHHKHSKWNLLGANRPQHRHIYSPHCVWLNFEHTKNSNRSKKSQQRNSNSNLLINSKKPRNRSKWFRAEWYSRPSRQDFIHRESGSAHCTTNKRHCTLCLAHLLTHERDGYSHCVLDSCMTQPSTPLKPLLPERRTPLPPSRTTQGWWARSRSTRVRRMPPKNAMQEGIHNQKIQLSIGWVVARFQRALLCSHCFTLWFLTTALVSNLPFLASKFFVLKFCSILLFIIVFNLWLSGSAFWWWIFISYNSNTVLSFSASLILNLYKFSKMSSVGICVIDNRISSHFVSNSWILSIRRATAK